MIRKPSQPRSRQLTHHGQSERRPGTLFLVGTPIGDLNDLTLRAVDILTRVAVVAAETPLATQALLAHHGIEATVTSYGPQNHQEKIAVLLHRLREGQDVALVSDSGMPVIYDPGRRLIEATHSAGLPVKVIPGPSALTAAIAISGYSGDRVVFEGRLPRTRSHLLRFIARFKGESRTAVFFVARTSLSTVLESLVQVLPFRNVVLAIDLARPDGAVYRGKPKALLMKIPSLCRDAAITLVLQGGKNKR